MLADRDKIIAELSKLGLTNYEASAYHTLLRRDSFTAAELSLEAEIPRQRIYDVIETLEKKGLCQPRTTSPRILAATEPGLALSGLRARRTRELEEQRAKVEEETVDLAFALKNLYGKGRGEEAPLSYIELYRDPAQMASVAGELARTVTREIKLYLGGPSVFEREVNVQLLEEALSRGVSCRALCGPGASSSQEFGSLPTTYLGRGLELRRLEGTGLPASRAQIFDGLAVLLFFPDPLAGSPSFQALLVRHPHMLALMNFTFESLWGDKRTKDIDAQGHTR